MFQACSLFSCNTFFWNTLLCLEQSNSCFLRVWILWKTESLSLSVVGSWTCEVTGVRTDIIVTHSPMQAEVTRPKKLRSMQRKEWRDYEIPEREKYRDREDDACRNFFIFLNLSILPTMGSRRLHCIHPGNLLLLNRGWGDFCSLKPNIVSEDLWSSPDSNRENLGKLYYVTSLVCRFSICELRIIIYRSQCGYQEQTRQRSKSVLALQNEGISEKKYWMRIFFFFFTLSQYYM